MVTLPGRPLTDTPMASEEQSDQHTGRRRTYRELKTWLRTLPDAERVEFLDQLAQRNERFSLRLAKSARLSPEAAGRFLRGRLHGDHVFAPLLIRYFEPLIGKDRFWQIAAQNLRPESLMFRALNFHSGGQLTDPTGETGRAWRVPHLRWYALILLLAFAAFALTTAPAWIAASLAEQLSGGKVKLEQTSGSLWNGSAAAIVFPQWGATAQRFENFSWQVLPARLLGGEAAADVKLDDPQLSAQAQISSGLSHTTVSRLQAAAQAPLIATFVPVLDFWKPRGTVRISGDEIALRPLAIRSPVTIEWQGATLSLSEVAPLGDYRLYAQPEREWINLDLQTIKGALLVSGTGQYSPAKGGEFQYRAQAAPGYTEQLEPLVNILGLKETDGSVTFKIPLAPWQ